MSLVSWFADRAAPRFGTARSSPAATAWVGVQAQQGLWLVARSDGSRAGARPRILGCAALPGDAGSGALAQWWRSHAGRRDAAALLLDSSDYQVLQINSPPVAADEYRNAARWLIKEQIDFPCEQAALDCFAVPADGDGPAARLHTVVARQDKVAQTVGEWRGAGVPLRAIDIPELALRNLALLACGDQASAFLHIGVDETRLLLLWRSEMCVARLLPFGARLLRTLEAPQRDEHFERLALEIQRSVDAFGRQFSAAHLNQLWVSALHDSEGACAALAAQVSLRVQVFEPADWIDFDDGVQPFDLDAGIDHTMAIGAALRHAS